MAHEVERMMFVGEKPWHIEETKDFSKEVSERITTGEAIGAAGLDWEVSTVPVYVHEQNSLGIRIGEKEAPALATVRSSDQSILGVVGPCYRVLQNRDAFKFFDAFLETGVCTLESAGSLRGGKRVWVLAKIKGDPIDVVKDDPIEKYILISNSHDGTLAIRVGYTPIRVVCMNTLAMALGTRGDGSSGSFGRGERAGGAMKNLIRICHRGSPKDAVMAVAETMDVINRSFAATVEQFKMLAQHEISHEDLEKYVKLVFRVSPVEEKDMTEEEKDEFEEKESRVVERIVPLFYGGGRGSMIEGVGGTFWGAYNAITEYVGHHRGKDPGVRLDSTWFGDGQRITRKALSVATSMVAGASGN